MKSTRRDILKSSLGIAGILASQKCPAYIKSIIAASNTSFAMKDIPFAKEYLQTGLLSMWDGKENAGWGEHDGDALTWKDLVSDKDMTLQGSASFGDSYIYFPAYKSFATFTPFTTNDNYTIEFVSRKFFTNVATMAVICIANTYRNSVIWQGGNYPVPGYQITAPNKAPKIPFAKGDTSIHSVSICWNGLACLNGASSDVRATNYWYNRWVGHLNGDDGGIDRNGDKSMFFNIRVYDHALTEDEVAHNYEIDRARFKI